MLRIGFRISELCGLTETDIDFESRLINIDHQLSKISGIDYHVDPPKTKSGIRQIRMSVAVYEALGRLIKNRGRAKPIVIKEGLIA